MLNIRASGISFLIEKRNCIYFIVIFKLRRLENGCIYIFKLSKTYLKKQGRAWTECQSCNKHERINKLFIGLRLWSTSLLKNTSWPAKWNLFVKNGYEGTDDSALHEIVAVSVAEIGKCGPRQEPMWLQDSLPCPLRKKNKYTLFLVLSNFSEPWRGEEKYEQWAKFPLELYF